MKAQPLTRWWLRVKGSNFKRLLSSTRCQWRWLSERRLLLKALKSRLSASCISSAVFTTITGRIVLFISLSSRNKHNRVSLRSCPGENCTRRPEGLEQLTSIVPFGSLIGVLISGLSWQLPLEDGPLWATRYSTITSRQLTCQTASIIAADRTPSLTSKTACCCYYYYYYSYEYYYGSWLFLPTLLYYYG